MPTPTSTTATGTKEFGCDVWRLEYRDPSVNANKFYEVYASENGVCLLRWGRSGAVGQTKGTLHSDEEGARAIALRQVHTKIAKGYIQKKHHRFMATENALNDAFVNGDMATNLVNQGNVKQQLAARDTVLRNYSDFADRVQDLLDQAEEQPIEVVLVELDEVESVWKEIAARHGEVSTALQVARAVLAQRLLGPVTGH